MRSSGDQIVCQCNKFAERPYRMKTPPLPSGCLSSWPGSATYSPCDLGKLLILPVPQHPPPIFKMSLLLLLVQKAAVRIKQCFLLDWNPGTTEQTWTSKTHSEQLLIQAVVNQFSKGQVVKNRLLWCISKWFLSLSHCPKHKEIFLQYLLFELLEINLTKLQWPPMTVSPGSFELKSCPHSASSNSSITVLVFLPGIGSQSSFCS